MAKAKTQVSEKQTQEETTDSKDFEGQAEKEEISAVVESAESGNVDLSQVNTIIDTLGNPAARKAAADKLNERIEAARAELDRLEKVKELLEPHGHVFRVTRSEGEGKTFRHLPGSHAEAILKALQGEKTGLTVGEILAKLQDAKHVIERSTLSTTINNLNMKGVLEQTGQRGTYRYKLS